VVDVAGPQRQHILRACINIDGREKTEGRKRLIQMATGRRDREDREGCKRNTEGRKMCPVARSR
jgi:hypothetical protein